MRWRAIMVLSLTGALLLADACGGGKGDEKAELGPSSDDNAPDPLDPQQLENEITGLLADYDDVVNQILADPQVTKDPDDPLVDQYLSLFEPDSEFATDALDTWRANADKNISIKPYDEEHPSNSTRLDGDIEVVSDDEVRFPTCSEFRQRVYEGDELVEGLPFMEQAGESVAVRADDAWVFRRRDVYADDPTCQTEGT